MTKTRTQRKKKKRTWLRVLGIIMLLLLIAGGALAYSVWDSLTDSIDNMQSSVDTGTDKNLSKKEPFSVLLLGVDQRDGDSGRSDTMIVLTVNPQTSNVKMLSIPRDTRTEIVGHGTVDKINHAYAFGGTEMTIDTVENFLDIPIDYFVEINMEGFEDIVNAIGGITVNNTLDFTYKGKHFAEGQISLNGEEALLYSRMRKQDPNGDFGRQARQRKVIEAIIKKGATISSLTNYSDIFDALGKNIETNLSFKDMSSLLKNYRNASKSIEEITIDGSGTKIGGIYYYVVPDKEKERIHTELDEHLQ